ncbi:MAG: DNA polymerase I, partial [Bacillota bacterium]|nr:DNA polymerase I [Bacillota bacterium]
MKILLIDGNSLINRSFYGVRPLTTREGIYTNAVYGFLNTFFKLKDEEKPDGAAVCFDMKEPTFRHLAFDGYKAKRTAMPDELAMQMPLLKEALDLLGVPRFELPSFEADDLIGTISRILSESGNESVIVTGDRDTLQLIGDKTRVKLVTTKMGRPVTTEFDETRFCEEYAGLTPARIIDLKALAGDSSDNIPGVPGVGDKTALELMTRFPSLDSLYENLESDEIRESVRKKLEAGKDSAFLSRRLATIDRNAPLEFSFGDAVFKNRDEKGLYGFFIKLEFKNLIEKMGLRPETNTEITKLEPKNTVRVISEDGLNTLLSKAGEAERVFLAAPRSLSAAAVFAGDDIYVALRRDFTDEAWDAFLNKLYSPCVNKVVHDAKPLMTELLKAGIEPGGFYFDTALGAYLLSPADTSYAIEKCALSYLGTEIMPESAFEDESAFLSLTADDCAIKAIATHALCVAGLYAEIYPKIKELQMEKLYFEIELPLAKVLAEMEREGFLADGRRLKEFGETLGRRIDECTGLIYSLCGGEFNINSTKALGEILFVKLGLPIVKKTKTGYSTDIDVLNRLRDKHEIIPLIIEYRQLTKLKSTYVDGLFKVIDPLDGRIHSSFNQMITVTGRLSSTEPNLQNIPVRHELGSEIRHMFAAKEGCVLLDADYSQIELRVLAHIAKDERMTEAFLNNEDIHTVTASQVFGVRPEEVTQAMRRAAKAVNFGIVYGISAFSLSEDIGVSVAEAGRYIESYLDKYAGVKRYMDEIRKKAKEDGFVTTLLGRRRYLPELSSSNFNIRSFGERVALNTPIQGTAADIIKIAMVRVCERLRRQKLRSRLILQVHDELIIETRIEEADEVSRLLKEEMEGAFPLDSRLVAEVTSG